MTEAPAFPGNFVETAQTLDRATIDALREAVALGRWPNGAKLSKEQQGLCLEAVLAWGIGTYRRRNTRATCRPRRMPVQAPSRGLRPFVG